MSSVTELRYNSGTRAASLGALTGCTIRGGMSTMRSLPSSVKVASLPIACSEVRPRACLVARWMALIRSLRSRSEPSVRAPRSSSASAVTTVWKSSRALIRAARRIELR